MRFSIDARLTLSFSKESAFLSIWNRTWKMSQHKSFEIDVFYHTGVTGVAAEWTSPLERDHHGFNLELSLLGLTVNFTFYDNRPTESFE